MKHTLSIFALTLLLSAPALAQEEESFSPPSTDPGQWSGSLTLGGGVAPDYEGSDDYQAIPFLGAEVENGPYWARLRGLEAYANVVAMYNVKAGEVVR